MSERFDSLSQAMAEPTSRRGALKVLGVTALAAAGAVVLRPFRSGTARLPRWQPDLRAGVLSQGRKLHRPGVVMLLSKGHDAVWADVLSERRGLHRLQQGSVRLPSREDALRQGGQPHLLSGGAGMRSRVSLGPVVRYRHRLRQRNHPHIDVDLQFLDVDHDLRAGWRRLLLQHRLLHECLHQYGYLRRPWGPERAVQHQQRLLRGNLQPGGLLRMLPRWFGLS